MTDALKIANLMTDLITQSWNVTVMHDCERSGNPEPITITLAHRVYDVDHSVTGPTLSEALERAVAQTRV